MFRRTLTSNICRYSCQMRALSDSSGASRQTEILELKALSAAQKDFEVQSMNSPLVDEIDKEAIFVHNEVNLGNIQVYGFDYDYTLASYTQELDRLIFEEARNVLISKMHYPNDLQHFQFNPHFATRGLHYDVKRALLMKLDAYNNIQLDTVYHGLTPVTRDAVSAAYQGSHIPKATLRKYSKENYEIIQLMDFFVIPEINLLCNVIEYFERHQIRYQAPFVHNDVSTAVRSLHKSGLLHNAIIENPERFIVTNEKLRAFLRRLVDHNRQLFVISNSPARFINQGMNYLVGRDWREFFDVIIVNAQKPGFFQEMQSPFRQVNEEGLYQDWQQVTELKRGQIYQGGNMNELNRLKHWPPRSLLYFGDHVYSDLADATNNQGWMTGAIVPELDTEIEAINSKSLRNILHRLRLLESLIDSFQHYKSPAARAVLENLLEQRRILRFHSKSAFNPHFGSIFRTFHNPSNFSQRLGQFSVLYTSNVTNFLNYSVDHVFYPRRTLLPHEPVAETNGKQIPK